MRNASNLRVGDAERNAATAALGEHFAAGRLDQAEFDDRTERALRARTGADLDRLFADLPRPARAAEQPRPQRFSLPLLPLLLVTIGLIMLLPAEFSLFLLAGVLLLARFAWRRRVRSYRALAHRPRSHWMAADAGWRCGRARHR